MRIQRRSLHDLIPRFDENAVVKLIIYLGVTFILARFTILLLIVYDNKGKDAETIVNGFLGLPPVYNFIPRWWTLFTHAWVHSGFWHWLSNMVWLFMFGSSFQLLAGKRQVIPLFIMSYFLAGVFYLLCQWLPMSALHVTPPLVIGAQAGVMGFAVAIITLAPRYRYYFSDYFSLPMWGILIAFAALMGLSVGFSPVGMIWLLGGALGGFVFAQLFKKGYDPGGRWYGFGESALRLITPKEKVPLSDPKRPLNSIQKIDTLLEKINQHGYESLSQAEKELLNNESKKL